ncbi:hypothetical protein CHCC15291_0669 [Bacillus licheniformis]|nr:hypothetical protein CHCC15291_0669 [Bacillus licheniformis]TWL99241.1 hypothetical protein CHCC15289_4679 [Bacillus licheniformis]
MKMIPFQCNERQKLRKVYMISVLMKLLFVKMWKLIMD